MIRKVDRVVARNLLSHSGRPLLNQMQITAPKGTYLQSYGSTIAFKPKEGKVVLGKNWKYSTTTSKYRSIFLAESTKETEAKLKSGEYILDNTL